MKDFDKLTFSDNFIFQKVILNEAICRHILELILNIKIDRIIFREQEKFFKETPESRGVRLDVYVKDGKGTVYNVEMQTRRGRHKRELRKRSRYYRSLIDLSLLREGDEYHQLPDSYVIFICSFDEFGLNRSIYRFRSICPEAGGLELGDGACAVFINSKGLKAGLSEDLKGLLAVINNRPSKNKFAGELRQQVENVKRDAENRREYMLLSDLVMEEYGDRLEKEVAREVAKEVAKERKKAKEELKAKEREFIEAMLPYLSPEVIAEKLGCSKAEVLRIARKKA